MAHPEKPLPQALPPLKLWTPFVLWLILIFVLSAYPKAIIPQSKYISWDKIAHLIEFGILGFLTARAAYYSRNRWIVIHYKSIAVIFGICYGISDEVHQLFVRSRYASVYDVIADAIGVMIGVMLFAKMLRRMPKGREALKD
ncbi:MAG: VanZ family protein [bacterium]